MTIFSAEKKPLIMGVVNVTPDSFSDGGQYLDHDKAISHAHDLLKQGADILDIGGESTRPGAEVVPPNIEQDRILPVIQLLKQQKPDCVISVDTRNASTMERAIEQGVDIINDVSALTHDPDSIEIVAQAQKPVILMHAQGVPQTMQDSPAYNNVTQQVHSFLKERIDLCLDKGIQQSNIIVDPGIGFGKNLAHNLSLIKNIGVFQTLECPILLGTSRKSFIEAICPNTPAENRLAGSLSSLLWGLEKGANLFRVHDVEQSVQAIKVWKAIQGRDDS